MGFRVWGLGFGVWGGFSRKGPRRVRGSQAGSPSIADRRDPHNIGLQLLQAMGSHEGGGCVTKFGTGVGRMYDSPRHDEEDARLY